MVKVLIVLPTFDGNGITKLFQNYCSNHPNDICFTFLSTDTKKHGLFESELSKIGNTVSLPCSIRKPFDANRKFHRFFSTQSFDIVHANSYLLSAVILSCAKRSRIKTRIFHSHAADVPENFLRKFLRFILTKVILKNSTDLFACSRSAAIWMFGKRLGEKTPILNNAIQIDDFKFSEKKRMEIRKKYGIGEKAFCICNVGRISPQKQPLVSLRIFMEILKTDSSAKIIFCGGISDENLFSKMKFFINQNHFPKGSVVFTGDVKNVPEILDCSDAFLLTSAYEGLGIVLIESQANGLPTFCPLGIPPEANVSPLFMPFSLTADSIAEKILKSQRDFSFCGYKGAKENGFDILTERPKLMAFYKNCAEKKNDNFLSK